MRRKPARRPLPEHLPRERVVYPMPVLRRSAAQVAACNQTDNRQGFPKVAMRSTLHTNSTRFSSMAGSRRP